MSTEIEALESGLELYRSLIAEDAALRAEFQASQAEFFRRPREPAESPERALGDRRHLEWFLLERPSAVLRRPPIEVLEERWHERAGPGERALTAAYRGSLASVFEVTGIAPGEGVWLADLAGRGEYPVREPQASGALATGDLVVGRVFPVEDSLYRLSRAAAVFRNAELLAAIRKDVEDARAGRRGVMRITQSELEAMFWAPRASEVSDPVGEVRRLLAEVGLELEEIDRLLAGLSRAPYDPSRIVLGVGDALGSILDRLAFETTVDLDRARELLLHAWAALSGSQAGEPVAAQPTSETERTEAPGKRRSALDVRAAIEAFDEGRAAGVDIEELFDALESQLELDQLPDSPDGDEQALAPDFPGVVGAMIEEYLWEGSRERGAFAPEEVEALRTFAGFAAGIGLFEELGARELLLYTTFWLPESGRLTKADQAHATLVALRGFCRWAEEEQQVALWSAFGRSLGALRASLPRIIEANQRRTREEPTGGEIFTLLAAEDEALRVRDQLGVEEERRVDPMLAQWLRPGDRLRASRVGEDRLAVFCCYPPELAELDPGR